MCCDNNNTPNIKVVVEYKYHTGEFKGTDYTIRLFREGDEVFFNLMSVWDTYTSLAYESITGQHYCRMIEDQLVKLIFVKQQPTGAALEKVWYHVSIFLRKQYLNKFNQRTDIMKDYVEAL